MKQQDRGKWTSASNALADSLCPGRHLAQAGIPEGNPGADAHSGAKIHKALANSQDRGHMETLTLPERETFDTIRDIERKVAGQYFGEKYEPMRVFREERYWLWFKRDAGSPEVWHSGQPDVVMRSGVKALILEYKTLAGDVPDSPRNLQLRDQAVLVRAHFKIVSEVATAVIQPFVTHTPELCLYTSEDLDRATAEMFERVLNSNDPTSRRFAGKAQCQFCRAVGQCVEYQKWAGQMSAPALLPLLDVPLVNWTPEQRSVAAEALGPCQKFLDQIKQSLKDGLKADPEFVPGWALDNGREMETITDPQVCFERFVKVGGEVNAFMRCVKVLKSKLREELHNASQQKGKELEASLDALTNGIVDTKRSEPALKKVGEK